jgi:tricorn protease
MKPSYSDVATAFVYQGTDVLVMVPLRKDVKSPFAPTSDEEPFGKKGKRKPAEDAEDDAEEPTDDTAAGDDEGEAEEEEPAARPRRRRPGARRRRAAAKKPRKRVKVDLDGFEARAIRIPVDRGSFTNLAVAADGKLFYVRDVPRGAEGKPSVRMVTIQNGKATEKTVLEDVRGFSMSADGKSLLVRKRRAKAIAIVKAAPDQKMGPKLDLSGLQAVVEPRAEWAQIVRDAWRLERQFFYDPTMHGVDWDAMYERYAALLPDCVSREDVGVVIREMISELNVGHAYYGGGDVESAPSVSVGMLGVDFELHGGAYRIARIHEGAPWDLDARSPLKQPGAEVSEGEYLLAVNGLPLDATRAPWAAFQGLADKVVSLTVSKKPTLDEEAREVVVKALANESTLRYRAWVEANRKHVEERTNGRVGYVYVPNTGVGGQNELVRQFYGQIEKDALIVDERWNGGGQIPTRFVEVLDRPVTNYWARRHGRDWVWPPDSHHGPKCMLINGLAGSGGDAFPAYFRQAGLGKLIGTRTWGGLVGIQGGPRLIDGARVTIPSFAYYDKDGTWGIEGHGVDPDIEVIDDPALMVDGTDPQLEAAIELMLTSIPPTGAKHPPRPGYPDRSGMGIPDEDK